MAIEPLPASNSRYTRFGTSNPLLPRRFKVQGQPHLERFWEAIDHAALIPEVIGYNTEQWRLAYYMDVVDHLFFWVKERLLVEGTTPWGDPNIDAVEPVPNP